MKNLKILVLLSGFLFAGNAMAQDPDQRVREVKQKFITEKVALQDDQKEEFWQTYRSFDRERRDIRIKMSQNRLGLRMSNVSEKEAEQMLDTELKLKQELLDLESDYIDKYKEILSVKQIIALYKAEDDFNKMMMQRLRQRDGNRNPGNPRGRGN